MLKPGLTGIRGVTAAVALIVCLAGASSCLDVSGPKPLPQGGIHVLFVGNSLTYVNDLPGMVATIGESVGDTIRVAQATNPDLALIDHLNGGSNAVAQIQLGGWQYVVLQQGPSSLSVNRDSLILWTRMFDAIIRPTGAKTSLYMVWPAIDRLPFMDDVRISYQQAAQAVNGVFMPAGVAWQKAWAADATLPLYGGDGYHPSLMGSYLAALVIYERVTSHDCRLTPAHPFATGMGVSDATVRLLQSAAHDADQQFP